MFKQTMMGLALVAGSAVASQAATIYPSAVIGADQNGTVVAADRSNTANALGPADGKFYSLGFGGYITFEFAKPVIGEGFIAEVTFGNRDNYEESVELWTSLDGVTFEKMYAVTNASNPVALSFATPYAFKWIALVDTSPYRPHGDGFDVDSFALTPAAIPLPAAGLLLGGALLGLGALRRRKNAA